MNSSGATASREDLSQMVRIKSISCRRILNSHAEFTLEFMVELDSGANGIGSSPRGETISIYEDRTVTVEAGKIIETIKEDQYLNASLDQSSFDKYLQKKIPVFGRNNAFALSLAFYNATRNLFSNSSRNKQESKNSFFPRLCLNILNGGKHAYTNPVLSDFPEYLLVSKENNIEHIIHDHKKIQEKVKERLLLADKTIINGNVVHTFGTGDNSTCIETLLEIVESLDLANSYDLMIDASAGDLWSGDGYRFPVTDHSMKTSEELCGYWLDLIAEYDIKYLEDPFHEQDFKSWARLTSEQEKCRIIGDNLYSSDAHRIRRGAVNRYTHGAIVKPNQAGTVSDTILAIKEAQKNNQLVITSHRSISTESTFLSSITNMCNADCIKIGPLHSDYSSIIRLNELMRLTTPI